jgi:uncharacterized protein YbaA (DUF1428 family)
MRARLWHRCRGEKRVSIARRADRREKRRRAVAPSSSALPFHSFFRRLLMNYVDGFAAAVPTANRTAYHDHAALAAKIFKEQGAISVVECWGDDVPEGKLTSFPMAVQRQPGETVIFAWITWPSKAVRDAGMKQVMEDPRLQNIEMPFDGKRMIFGGFEVLLTA